MAKVSRSMLKSIVKECLVELLAEGLSGGDTSSLNESLNIESKAAFKQEMMSEKRKGSGKVVNPDFVQKTKQIISLAKLFVQYLLITKP